MPRGWQALWSRGSGRRGAEAAAGRARCSGLEIPSTRGSQEGTKGSEERDGTLRTPVPVRGSAVRQRLAGLTVLIQGHPAGSPGSFPSHLSRLPEALGLRELPHCFSSSGLHVCVSCRDCVRKFGGVLTNSTVTDAEAEVPWNPSGPRPHFSSGICCPGARCLSDTPSPSL